MLLNFKIGLLLFFVYPLWAVAGNVSVSGQVAAQGCSFLANKDMVFDFGNNVVGSTVSVGDVLGSKFNLMIIQYCPKNVSVSYRIEGEPDENNPDLFRVASGAGQAEGVAYRIGVRIPTIGNTFVQVYPKIQSSWIPTTDASTTATGFSIGVQIDLETTLGKVTSGVMDTSMTFSILYQ